MGVLGELRYRLDGPAFNFSETVQVSDVFGNLWLLMEELTGSSYITRRGGDISKANQMLAGCDDECEGMLLLRAKVFECSVAGLQ
jgi:hypothetical protein